MERAANAYKQCTTNIDRRFIIDDRRKAMSLEDLTEEQKAKARECKTPEEFAEFAKEEGVELSLDELEAASGGYCDEKCWRDCS